MRREHKNGSLKYPVTHQWLAMHLSTFRMKERKSPFLLNSLQVGKKTDRHIFKSIELFSNRKGRKRRVYVYLVLLYINFIWNENHRLTYDMNITELCFGGDRVNLAHVSTMIFLFDIVYMKEPCSMLIMFIMCYTDPWISGDYMIVNGQNCWLLKMDPRNLHIYKMKQTRTNIKTVSINDLC